MTPSGPTDPEGNPFEGFGFLGDLARMLQGAGAVGGDAARQFAQQIASAGVSEPNPDPMERLKLGELARVAEMKVGDVTGLSTSTTGSLVSVVPVTRAEWARRALDAYRPVLERLASLTAGDLPAEADEGDDPMTALFGGLAKAMAPMLLPLLSGSLVGQLATRSLGQYDLPIPRPPSDELVVVSANVDAFATEWSLPGDDLRLWLCLSELATHAVFGVPHVRAALTGLLESHAAAFRVEGDALESKMGELDLSQPDAVQELFGDPLALLGAVQSPEQRALLPRLEALVAVVVGYVDWVVETTGTGLIGSFSMLTEALHRRRVEADSADRFVESLFGLSLGAEQYERGDAFIAGAVERAGAAGLARLWEGPEFLPTPAEVDAPGLWLARIEYH
jgi:putative hydrolase